MNTAQRIIKNTAFLLVGQIIAQLLGFVAVVYLARVLGPGNFGKISFASAIVIYFTLLVNLGLPILGTREIAKDKDKIKEYVGSITALRLCLAVLAFGLLVVFVIILKKPAEIKYLIIIFGLGFLPNALGLAWTFQAIEKMEYIGLCCILRSVIYVGLVLLLIKNFEQLLLIPFFGFIASLLTVGVFISIFITQFGKLKLKFNLIYWKNLLRQALPIGLANVMSVIIYYSDTVMLGFMKGDEVVGYYNAVYKITLALIMLAAAYFDAIFPVLSNYYKTSLDSFKKLQSYTMKLTVTAALPLAVGGVILARPIMDTLYGAEYRRGIIAFKILIWTVALLYLNSAYSKELWACDKQDTVFRIVALHAGIALLFNLILIPPFGLIGASVASVVGKVCEFLMYYRASRRIFRIPIHDYILKPLLASAVMGLFLRLAVNWNVLLLVFGGASLYLVSFYLMKGLTGEEIVLIKNLIGRQKLSR